MTPYGFKYLFIRLILILPIIIGFGLTGRALGDVITPAQTLDRDLEPVVINGGKVSALIGTPVQHLFIYTFSGSGLDGQIPIQIDEVTGNSYTTVEDGLLDSNDEIAFMAMDLGDQAADTTVLTGTLPISDTWYEIEVTDPISPTKQGWAYLVRSNTLASGISTDYVDYQAATQRITASQYELGFDPSHAGFDYLALNGSGQDILDRSKLRAVLKIPPFFEGVLTENELTGSPGLIKDGPVRVILQQSETVDLLGIQASFEFINLAYASLVQSITRVSFSLGAGTTLSSVRTSTDLNSNASGATFYNAHTPGGVTVDGVPDVVSSNLSTWTQVTTTTGRVIQVTDSESAGGTQNSYYKDDSSLDTQDTGDQRSYGDAGISLTGSINSAFTAQISMFVLPAAGGENVGANYQSYVDNPFKVDAKISTAYFVYLPVIFK